MRMDVPIRMESAVARPRSRLVIELDIAGLELFSFLTLFEIYYVFFIHVGHWYILVCFVSYDRARHQKPGIHSQFPKFIFMICKRQIINDENMLKQQHNIFLSQIWPWNAIQLFEWGPRFFLHKERNCNLICNNNSFFPF